jgi:hypothetical protein
MNRTRPASVEGNMGTTMKKIYPLIVLVLMGCGGSLSLREEDETRPVAVAPSEAPPEGVPLIAFDGGGADTAPDCHCVGPTCSGLPACGKDAAPEVDAASVVDAATDCHCIGPTCSGLPGCK